MADRGRKPGSMNAKTLELRAQMEALVGMPLPMKLVKIALYLEETGQEKEAGDLMDKATKYAYPTLKAIEHSGEIKTEMPIAPEPGPAPLS